MRSKKSLRYLIKNPLPILPIFEFVQEASETSREEMIKIFNYGVGLAIFVPSQEEAEKVVELAKTLNLKAIVAGEVQASNQREVVVEPWNITLKSENFALEQ